MRTEFVIPFEFDSGPIERRLQESGYEEIVRGLTDECRAGLLAAMPSKSGYGYYGDKAKSLSDINWRSIVSDRIDAVIREHIDEVVDEAAVLLAMRAGRKKAWRELLEEYREERDGQ